ncbi:MAG: hypothetical protein KGI50_00205 [Patescibacteria group bacterium]|nr:hypothetical protein [Patescibacteria group bacterium]MDE2438216.1 hypothetical protein [Patescibacteria group bacterium]
MSVVAVRIQKKEIVIGADSIRISGLSQEKDKLAKLSRISTDMVLGTVGSCALGFLFKEFLENHLPKQNSEYEWMMLIREFVDYLSNAKNAPSIDTAEFLVVYHGKVFFISGYFIREIKDYYSIGAGKDYALSALYLGASVEKAIQTACHLSILCEEPINTITISLRGS